MSSNLSTDRRLRPVSSARARVLRKRGVSVWWDERLQSLVWQMPKPQKPDHAHVYRPAGKNAEGDDIERCWCGKEIIVETVYRG